MKDEKDKQRKYETPETLDVGFYEDKPRFVQHQHELDRLVREWHSVKDDNVALRKGREIVSKLMEWIMYRPEFDEKDRREAEAAYAESKLEIKTKRRIRAIGSEDEHYIEEWDSYSVEYRKENAPESMEHMRREAVDVKLDRQSKAFYILRGICGRRGLLKLDYPLGRTVKDEILEGMS